MSFRVPKGPMNLSQDHFLLEILRVTSFASE